MALDKRKLSKAVKEKYSFKDETFVRVAKDNPKDKVEIEIGDSKQPDFKPQVKVQRWDNEVNLSFRLKDDGAEQETVDTVADKIVWKKGKREVRFYDLPESEALPEGGYEFEVVLLEKPATNVVEFSLNTKGLDFFYQPALTPEEIAEGASQPENVVGSYAVYASEKKTNWVGGKEYKCGKVGHIYRPQIEDANGVKVWGELNVDTVNGILSVTIPQDFLDNAVYPVRHAAGLTFGYTSVGAANSSFIQSSIVVQVGTLPGNGNVSSVSIYGRGGGSTNIKGIIYDDSSTNPNNLKKLGDSVAVDITAGWDTSNTVVSLTTGTYWVGFVGNTTESYSLYYDTSTGTNSAFTAENDSYWTTPPDPITGVTTSSRNRSIYATYTAAGGSDPTPLRMLMGMGT